VNKSKVGTVMLRGVFEWVVLLLDGVLLRVMSRFVHANKKNAFLKGNFAPVDPSDVFVQDLVLSRGSLPDDLEGAYLRVGPNPSIQTPSKAYHWFDGDGMVHAIRIKDHKLAYFRHLIQTPKRKLEERFKRSLFVRFGEMSQLWYVIVIVALWMPLRRKLLSFMPDKVEEGTANTALVYHNRSLSALHEASRPFGLYLPSFGAVRSVGYNSYNGALKTSMTAHPKVDPVTKEMFYISYSPDYGCIVGVVSPDGELLRSVDIGLERRPMIHDFAITEHYIIVMDLPLLFRPDKLRETKNPYFFDSSAPSRYAIIPKSARSKDEVIWFSGPSCFVFHTANAWEEGDEIIVNACRFERFDLASMSLDENFSFGKQPARLHQWRFNLRDKTIKETGLMDRGGDFPVFCDTLIGRKSRFVYVSCIEPSHDSHNSVCKFDYEKKQVVNQYSWGPSTFAGECSFVPRKNRTSEDDGYLVTFVHNTATNKSSFIVIDSKTFAFCCEVEIPYRVPYGFHGIFLDEEQIQKQYGTS